MFRSCQILPLELFDLLDLTLLLSAEFDVPVYMFPTVSGAVRGCPIAIDDVACDRHGSDVSPAHTA